MKAATPPAPPDELLRTGEACALLGICEKTLHLWANRGLIARVYLGPKYVRFRRSDVARIQTEGLNAPRQTYPTGKRRRA